jgi:hypothetical protein
MDKLQRCIEVLRALSPDDVVGNRTYAAELPVNHFISKELQVLRSSLERLRKAVRKAGVMISSCSRFRTLAFSHSRLVAWIGRPLVHSRTDPGRR